MQEVLVLSFPYCIEETFVGLKFVRFAVKGIWQVSTLAVFESQSMLYSQYESLVGDNSDRTKQVSVRCQRCCQSKLSTCTYVDRNKSMYCERTRIRAYVSLYRLLHAHPPVLYNTHSYTYLRAYYACRYTYEHTASTQSKKIDKTAPVDVCSYVHVN